MKKALAMLLTLAMLFSCLVVGVAEEAIAVPPQKLEDCTDGWYIGWEDTWEDGTVYTSVSKGDVHANYIDGVLDQYGYSDEVEGGNRVSCDFTADHRLIATNFYDMDNYKTYTSYTGGKTWWMWDEETYTEKKAELPEGVEVKPLPALGEYVYVKPVVADKLADADTENGKVNEYDWGTSYEGKNEFYAWYNENGQLESYSYWNEDHTIQVQCDWQHKVTGYVYSDGPIWYNSDDGETWTDESWDEELGDWVYSAVELPEGVEFEKLPALGEYVYSVAAPADEVVLEELTDGRLNVWTDEEGNVTDFCYQVGAVQAYYDADGVLRSYWYTSEDGKQTNYFNWNHKLTEIGIETATGWLYSYDGGETWGEYVWNEETEESTFVEAELPEGTEIADLPALGTSAEFDRVPVQNIEDLETRLGWVYEEEDEEGNVITIFYSEELAMHMYFDAAGALISYDFWTEDWSQYIEYSADNELLFAQVWTEDGKGYIYVAEGDTWYERVFDENGDEQESIKLEEAPADVEILPPLTNKVDEVWYPNNTMGVLGLPLRDTVPGLTNKWYHVVPVNVAVDGTTTIPLVASNLYFISNAYVTVAGDSITVTYDGLSPHGYGWIDDECVAWFTSLDQITTEWLNAPESDLAFGQEISRANDLDNAEIALLFICNHVTYRQPYFSNNTYLPRYWPNLAQWKAYRADLSALLNAVVPAETTEIVDSPVADDVVDSPSAGDIVDSPDAGDIVDSPDAGAVAE